MSRRVTFKSLMEISEDEPIWFFAMTGGVPTFYVQRTSVYNTQGQGIGYISGNSVFHKDGRRAFYIQGEVLHEHGTGTPLYYFDDPRATKPTDHDLWDVPVTFEE
jgi:hypothetical protein